MAGGTFVEGAKKSGLFLKHEIALLEAGQQTGRQDEAIADIASGVRQRIEERRVLIGGAIYPSIVIVSANLILPLPMIFTQGVSAYLARALWMPAIIGALAFVILIYLPRIPAPDPRRAWPLRIGQNLPIARAAVAKRAEAMFAFILGRGISAGLTIDRSLELAGEAAGTRGLRRGATVVRSRIRVGDTLADAMRKAGAFEDVFVGQVAQAEKTGTMDQVMEVYSRDGFDSATRLLRKFSKTMMALFYGAVLLFVAYQIVMGFSGLLGQFEEATNPVNLQ
jgi:type II secretory pathway component PulF